MSIHARHVFVGLLTVMLVHSGPALGQETETCVIGPRLPPLASADQDRLHALPHPAAAAHTALHGQGLFGHETLYLSHLAVFMGRPDAHPHNFQVILEIELENAEDKARYRADRAEHPDVLYTAVPLPFDQTALVTEYLGRAPLRRLPGGAVVRGHFEQGGIAILRDTTFEVRRIVHFREFALGGPRLERQHYLLFGRGPDLFAAHLLSAPPDFDQVLGVELDVQDTPTEAVAGLIQLLLAQGLHLSLPDRENAPDLRLQAGDTLACSLETGTRALPVAAVLRVVEELYCEAGEFDSVVMDRFNTPRGCDD